MKTYMDMLTLRGKRAVVTGGVGLIGKEISAVLAQAGAHVVIADVNEQGLRRLFNKLKKIKLSVDYYVLDISDIGNLDENINALITRFGPVDIWVNSAYPRTGDYRAVVEDITPSAWQKNVDIHLNSYSLSSKYAAQHMKSKGGSIINLGSIYGVLSPEFSVYEKTNLTSPMVYAAIKGGIINLGRYMAAYFGHYNIRVNTVCPGGVFNHQNKTFVKNYSKNTPLGRMARAEEVACTVLFLASDAATYITGATIMVDGGWSAK